jgi:hypothetical protein
LAAEDAALGVCPLFWRDEFAGSASKLWSRWTLLDAEFVVPGAGEKGKLGPAPAAERFPDGEPLKGASGGASNVGGAISE